MDALALLPLLLLCAGGVSAQCDDVVINTQNQGVYYATFRASAPVDIDGLILELTFHTTVNDVGYYAGQVTRVDNTTFLFTDQNTHVTAGEEISFDMNVQFDFEAPLVVREVMNDVVICDSPYSTPAPMVNPCDETGISPYDYGQALCMSYVFYEAERSGALPADQRVTWRGDSALDDGQDVGHDLSGGYYDAGDHVKFGFPMAYTATVLAWGLVDFKEGHQATGQLEYGLKTVKWATDYFLKAHTADYEFYGQVGSGGADHYYWGRPEDMTMERPSYKIDADHGGTELAGETAAALAAASIAFQDSDAPYASELLEHAKVLYDFADTYREKYTNSISDASGYYQSWSGYGDELCWAALWLARATGDDAYLTKARGHWDEFDLGSGEVVQFAWDDKRAGVFALYYLLTGEQEYLTPFTTYLDWLKDGATYSPEGLVILDSWGTNRHAANVAFLSLWAAKNGIDSDINRSWAQGQIDQLLGANSRHQRSFVVGFGVNPPERPHHRSSSCPYPPTDCTSGLSNPGPNPHVLYGALVGGPSENGDYADDRNDYVHNEVACDYNAAFSGALAGLVEIS